MRIPPHVFGFAALYLAAIYAVIFALARAG